MFPVYLLALQMTTIPHLESLRWQNRVIVIFAAEENDPKLKEQDGIVGSNREGFTERDIKVFRIVGESADAQSLRQKLDVAGRPFAVVLVGKDGSVKLRKYDPLRAENLFKTIDKMPMRKEEMKRQK